MKNDENHIFSTEYQSDPGTESNIKTEPQHVQTETQTSLADPGLSKPTRRIIKGSILK